MPQYIDFELKGVLLAQAEEAFSQVDFTPVTPKFAATVMLVDECGAEGALEVFMIKRARSMDFVPDAVVFPGGSASPDDVRVPLSWEGPTAAQWAEMLGMTDEAAAASIVICAVRELFEECGILLAAGPDGQLVDGAYLDGVQDARRALSAHELSLAAFLDERGLTLRSDLLAVQSNIVTPSFSKKRYDTFFFAARLPEGQAPDGDTSESVASEWARPEFVMSEADEGRLQLLAPTRLNLELLVEGGSIDAILGKRSRVEKIEPAAVRLEDGRIVVRERVS